MIDRSFLADIRTGEEQQKLTALMIGTAPALGVRTPAEGFETAGPPATLHRLGCGGGQGYHAAKPMSQADTFGWLRPLQTRRALVQSPKGGAQAAAGGANMP